MVFIDPELWYVFAMMLCTIFGVNGSPSFFIINMAIYIKENKLLLYVIVSTVEHAD